jgi:hypothetical protein
MLLKLLWGRGESNLMSPATKYDLFCLIRYKARVDTLNIDTNITKS